MTLQEQTPLAGFLAAWLGDPDAETRQRLREALREHARGLEGAWSPHALPCEGLWQELARCVPLGTTDDGVVGVVQRMHVIDLSVALGCRQGNKVALAHCERVHMVALGPTIARVDSGESFIDEVKQRVRTKLFVALGDEPPKIAHYKGEGPLLTWLRVVAAREAISSVRADRRHAVRHDADLAALAASTTGPELGALKDQYREHFKVAFEASLRDLEPGARNLLRLHYLHGLSIDALGRLLELHRSTAARRIAKVREQLLTGTRRALQARLRLGGQDFTQLMGLIESRLDLSIERFLADGDQPSSGAQ